MPLIGMVLITACTAPEDRPVRPIPAVMESRAKLTLALDQCTEIHGYAPGLADGIAEGAMAPGELEWRECAYQAIRDHVRANPEMRERYERLIAEDIDMTAAVRAGTMTRSQRRDRLNELIAEIRAVEDMRARTELDIRQIQTLQLQQTFEGLKEFTR